jgi:hypothetical protein
LFYYLHPWASSDPLPDPLWEHYYAKALNQYYDSLERFSPYKDGGLEAININ